MKITAVSSLIVNAQMRNWVFVKIETDQPGLIGWGEASLEWKTRAVAGAVQDIAELLIGEDHVGLNTSGRSCTGNSSSKVALSPCLLLAE